MAWTTFNNLTTPPTLPELDANFTTLSFLVNTPCAVVGTNTLTLTPIVPTAALSQYQQGMTLNGIATATNSGAVQAQLGILPLLPVYKDSPTGPIALTGSEIVQQTSFALVYDSTLNAGAGGFHLQNSLASLNGVLLSSLNVTNLGAGLLSAGTFALSQTVFGTVSATLGTINNLLTGIGSVATLVLGTGAPLLRVNSTLASAVFTGIVPNASQDQTVVFTGVQPFDNILIGWSLSPAASLIFSAWSPAAGSVVLRALNPVSGATVTAGTVNFRITNLGWT